MFRVTISIRTVKDLERFQRKLPFYRSVFCQWVDFEVKESYIPISTLVIALNLKNRIQRTTYIYDTLCTAIDQFYHDTHYCQFCDNQCFIQRKIGKFENGCCRKCIHITKKGCSTQNLTCKMFQCQSIKEQYPTASWDDFSLLCCFNIRQRLILKAEYFSTREETIREVSLSSIFIATIFIGYRFLFQTLLKRK